MFYEAASFGHAFHEMAEYGWNLPKPPQLEWKILMKNVQTHIKSLNWGYKSSLSDEHVDVVSAKCSFVGPNQLRLCTTAEEEEEEGIVGNLSSGGEIITADRIVIAVGGRPLVPAEIKGAKEHGITSDDLFGLEEAPGKTLIVGASYIALECAGILHGLGMTVDIAMRSIPLRGFDRDMADRVQEDLQSRGLHFHQAATVASIVEESRTPVDNHRLTVVLNVQGTKVEGRYDTVLWAIGRRPSLHALHLTDGSNLPPMAVDGDSGRLAVNDHHQTSIPHIYAVGDAADAGMELTPVAIRHGQEVAAHILATFTPTEPEPELGKEQKKEKEREKEIAEKADFSLSSHLVPSAVPTTVFVPLPYGSVGWSEEEAQWHKRKIAVWHVAFKPVEWAPQLNQERRAYLKMLVDVESDQIVGFHCLCPHAGEITQIMATVIAQGLTKAELDATLPLHPTIAEKMEGMD